MHGSGTRRTRVAVVGLVALLMGTDEIRAASPGTKIPRQAPEQVMEQEFISWFDTLGYDGQQSEKVKRGRRGSKEHRHGVDCAHGEDQKELQKHSAASVKARASPVRLPRVATLPREPVPNHQPSGGLPIGPKTLSRDAPRRAAKRKAADFWRECNVVAVQQVSNVGFVPSLVYDLRNRRIRWVCFNEASGEFTQVQDLENKKTEVLESLCYFGSTPVAVVKRFDRPKKVLFSKEHVVAEMERLNELFRSRRRLSQNQRDENACELYVFQAFVPTHFGNFLSLASCSNYGNQVVRSLRDDGFIVNAQIEAVHEARSETDWVLEVSSFDFSGRRKESKRPLSRNSSKSTMPQGSPVSWCLGDVCKSKDLSEDEIRALESGKRKPLVYKMVLQHRFATSDAREIMKRVPPRIQAKLYDQVRVCALCFEELWKIEKEKLAAQETRRRKKKEAKLRNKCRRTYTRAAVECARLAVKQAHRRAQEQSAARGSLQEKPPSGNDPLGIGCLSEDRGDDSGCDGFDPGEAMTENLGGCSQDLGPQDESSSSSVQREDPNSATKSGGQQMRAIREIVTFDAITCSSFFGDDLAKLNLCQGIMDALRGGKDTKLVAPIVENNSSIEECRLVLRSIYLEFRGICIDQGFFPEVPVEGPNAVMTLQSMHGLKRQT